MKPDQGGRRRQGAWEKTSGLSRSPQLSRSFAKRSSREMGWHFERDVGSRQRVFRYGRNYSKFVCWCE